MPSRQENSTGTPASLTTSSTDRSGGTVSVHPDRASTTSKAPAGAASAVGRTWANRSMPWVPAVPADVTLLHGPKQRLRAAGVHQRANAGRADEGGEVQQAARVLRPDPRAVPVALQAVQKRHGAAGAVAVSRLSSCLGLPER
ncbi:hypothetical protein [Streptomyces sp. NPDC050263]|uniref:hypothetical protein n=1 Tax=Streptomyces sp. NPDC050263 TaxID=3155037 RepID=UPI003423C75E